MSEIGNERERERDGERDREVDQRDAARMVMMLYLLCVEQWHRSVSMTVSDRQDRTVLHA
jgi:hypothetical protein